MTEIRKHRIYFLILLMLLLPLTTPFLTSVMKVDEVFLFTDEQNKNGIPKSSSFWVIGPIHIDGNAVGIGAHNWTWAEAQFWCSGNGSLINPYVIENITIDAGGANSGILIEDSNNKFFTIRNCTLINAGGILDGNGGIKLMKTTNGTLINNKCLNNMKFGIMLEDGSNYNLIQDNYIFNNTHGGIALYQSFYNTISNNNITDSGSSYLPNGMYISSNSEFNTISNNRIIDQEVGIELDLSSHNNTMSDNYISGCSYWGIGIFSGSSNTTIINNTVLLSENGIGTVSDGNLIYLNNITGINSDSGWDSGLYNKWDNGIIGNYWGDYGGSDLDDDGIGDSPYGIPGSTGNLDNYPIWDDGLEPIYIDGAATGVGAKNWTWAESQPWCTGLGTLISPYVIEGISRDGRGNGFCISIQNSVAYVEIRNCDLYNAGFTFPDSAILLNNVNNAKIIDNDLTNTNFVGVLMDNSDNNFIIRNNASLADLGILMTNSEFNQLINNTINDNIENAINIDDNSNFNTISGNIAIGNQLGISIFSDSDNNTVIGNTVMNNDWAGIGIISQSGGNTVLNNEISDNNIGVTIPTSDCNYNKIYNNNFKLNTLHAGDDSSNNLWNLGTLGNYWDNYTGVDPDDDGIGDIPYNVSGSASSKDNYPIWDDGDDINPTISINSPSGGVLFGASSPLYNIDIFDLTLNMSWYTLNGTATQYFFTPSNGINVIPIDETAWDSFSDGLVLMTFYVNDSGGNPASVSHVIEKDATMPTIILNSPIGGSTFGLDAPEFNLTIYDLNLMDAWYLVGSFDTPYPFSPVNGINIIQIDESVWDALSEGSVTITFFVNDHVIVNITAVNTQTIQVILNKDLPSSPEPAIPFGNHYIFFLGIGIITIVLAEHKRRKK